MGGRRRREERWCGFQLMETLLMHHFNIGGTQKAHFWNCHGCFIVIRLTPMKHTCENFKSQKYTQHGLLNRLSCCAIQMNKLLNLQVFPVIGQKRSRPAERPTLLTSAACVKQPAVSSRGLLAWTMRTAGRMESLSSFVLLFLCANMHTDRALINQ